jgi:hypothetical protein
MVSGKWQTRDFASFLLSLLLYKEYSYSYRNGGCASGFNHVEQTRQDHIYLVKGKHNVRFTELSSIDWSVMNRFDSFIIDLDKVIFVWNGKNANKSERLQVSGIFGCLLKAKKRSLIRNVQV